MTKQIRRGASDRTYVTGKEPPKQAVALKFDSTENNAPVVVAKGRGRIAEAIMNKAAENGVPIQQDISLVEVLSKLDIEQEIPPELYTLVAEILSFVYRSDRRAGEGKGSKEP